MGDLPDIDDEADILPDRIEGSVADALDADTLDIDELGPRARRGRRRRRRTGFALNRVGREPIGEGALSPRLQRLLGTTFGILAARGASVW